MKNKYDDYRQAGFASRADMRDAEFGLDVLAVFLAGGATGAVIAFVCWLVGVL